MRRRWSFGIWILKLGIDLGLDRAKSKSKKGRGVMGITEITPFIPLTLMGRWEGRGRFDIEAFGF